MYLLRAPSLSLYKVKFHNDRKICTVILNRNNATFDYCKSAIKNSNAAKQKLPSMYRMSKY